MMPYRMGRGRSSFWPYGAPWMGFWPHGFPYSCWPPFFPPSREEEEAMLTERAEFIEAELEQIRQRLKELRKPGKEKKNAKQA
jgi:hypothetical protein